MVVVLSFEYYFKKSLWNQKNVKLLKLYADKIHQHDPESEYFVDEV